MAPAGAPARSRLRTRASVAKTDTVVVPHQAAAGLDGPVPEVRPLDAGLQRRDPQPRSAQASADDEAAHGDLEAQRALERPALERPAEKGVPSLKIANAAVCGHAH